jgi:solute carrier family 25 aspartate/glutamate transporter 12/13
MIDHLISGYIAGSLGAFSVLPIDILKTRIQTQVIKDKTINIIKSIYYKNGIYGYYKGGTTQILCVGPEKAIKFTTNNYVLAYTDNKILSGMCAGLSQVIITNPMEILKIQMQMNISKKNYSIVDAYKQIGGITKLYKGVSMCALRDIPFSGIYFPLYSTLYALTNEYNASLLAGMIAAFIVTPMDVIKTRVQYKLDIQPINVFISIVKNEGIHILYRGSIWRALKSGPQFMITQVSYNYINTIII